MGASYAIADERLTDHDSAAPRLQVRGVGLWRGQRRVLDDVSLEIAPGEIFGLLGPNGSGKTSLLRCITGLLRSNDGSIWLDGRQLHGRDRAPMARIGVVFQDPSLDPKLTALENLVLGAALFGVKRREAKVRAEELLNFTELLERRDDRVEHFSGGMRRRLELARALIHKPEVLILDEPTTGLDPHAFERTWKRLLALRKSQDLTILISTHRADEAERCDRLAVMDRGHVIACDTPSRMLSRVSGDVVVLEAKYPEDVAKLLREEMHLHTQVSGGRVYIEHAAGHTLIPRLIEAFPNGSIASVSLRRPSLADAFLKLTGHELADAREEADA